MERFRGAHGVIGISDRRGVVGVRGVSTKGVVDCGVRGELVADDSSVKG